MLAQKSGCIARSMDYSVGSTVAKGDVVMMFVICSHPAIFNNMCVSCGEKGLNDDPSGGGGGGGGSADKFGSSLTVGHGNLLQLSKEEAAAVHVSKSSGLRSARKLALVLDLDLTLIHCIMVPRDAPPLEDCHDFRCGLLPICTRSIPVLYPFCTPSNTTPSITTPSITTPCSLDDGVVSSPFCRQTFRVKLRPGTEAFLKAAAEKYRLFVYTHGTRPYAEKVTSILDPTGTLVSHRIVSRSDTADVGKGVKSLSRIIGDSEDMAVIMDDNAEVWRKEGIQCLLHVKPFIYFKGRPDQWANMLSTTATSTREREGTGVTADAAATVTAPSSSAGGGGGSLSPRDAPPDNQLPRCLEVLEQVHAEYYYGAADAAGSDNGKQGQGHGQGSVFPPCGDILGRMRGSILKGCVVCCIDATTGKSVNMTSTEDEDARTKVLMDEGVASKGYVQARLAAGPVVNAAVVLGAAVQACPDATTTHMIVFGAATGPATLVTRPGVAVVHAEWMKHCGYAMARASEVAFKPRGCVVTACPEAAAADEASRLRAQDADEAVELVARAARSQKRKLQRGSDDNGDEDADDSGGGDEETDSNGEPCTKRRATGRGIDGGVPASESSESDNDESWLHNLEADV